MNPLGVLCVVVALVAGVAMASPTQQNSVSLKPSQWLKASELEATPSLDEVTFEQLENMPLEKGAKLMRKLYHLSQINQAVSPSFVPSPSNIPVYIFSSNGQKQIANLNTYVQVAKDIPHFGQQDVAIFITGLPQTLESVKKANTQLIQSYIQRISQKPQGPQRQQHGQQQESWGSSEQSSNWENQKPVGGYLVVIDLGNTITNVERYASLNVDQTGKMLGKSLVELTNECDVPLDIITVIGQGVGANVAGVAGKVFAGITSHKLRRITALDPASQMAKNPKVLTGLARGAADFVDAIHTSALGMGTTRRVGDVDFFPNGPSAGVPGARNVIEACMRATKYFAESLLPGNERNFPAIKASCLKQYKNNNGFGKRTYMGIATARDLSGDYMLEVNERSPYGQKTPAHKQNSYHGVHQTSSQQSSSEY